MPHGLPSNWYRFHCYSALELSDGFSEVGNMTASDILKVFESPKLRFAWLVAIAADILQILVFPLFAFGAVSPPDAVLDLVVAVILSRLLGWHWAFLPTLLAELVPGLDLFPTWTAAVLFVSWQRVRSQEPDILAPPRPVGRRFLDS